MISILFSVRQWLRITLSLMYLCCIAVLSLLPPNDFPKLPLFPGADKIVHLIMYLGLVLLACWAMHAEVKKKWYFIVTLFGISWGVLMEVFQYIMHLGRSFEFYDIIANSIGALFGVLIFFLLARTKTRIDFSNGKLEQDISKGY